MIYRPCSISFLMPMTTESVEQKNDYTPPGNITDLQIAGLDDNQIVLSWTAVGDDGVNGQAAAYYLVRYNTQPPQGDLGEWWAQAQPYTETTPPKTPGSPDGVRLTGLQSNQNYYIGIRVVDEADNASSLTLVTSVTTPVELIAFTAKVDKDRVFLDWKTASESNNLGFAVERKGSGEKNWRQIAFIPGAGTTQKTNSYFYEDTPGGIGDYSYRLRQCDTNGLFTYLPEIKVGISAPQTFLLAQNFPNPFNPSTSIHFQIPANAGDRVALIIYDLLGRQVRTLYDGNAQAGFYRMEWDGKDDLGRPAGTGVYFYILRSESGQITRKMIKVQ